MYIDTDSLIIGHFRSKVKCLTLESSHLYSLSGYPSSLSLRPSDLPLLYLFYAVYSIASRIWNIFDNRDNRKGRLTYIAVEDEILWSKTKHTNIWCREGKWLKVDSKPPPDSEGRVEAQWRPGCVQSLPDCPSGRQEDVTPSHSRHSRDLIVTHYIVIHCIVT